MENETYKEKNSAVIHDKIIIGGGAAGLMAAYSACKIRLDAGESPDVVLLEAGEVPGKKLAATGNGKCNFTNLHQAKDCYRSTDSEKAFRIVELFDHNEAINFFKNLGILYTERNGYCYPYGEQAKTFRNVLLTRVASLGAVVETSKRVAGIEKDNGVYHLSCSDGSFYRCRKLVICAGGSASPVFGSNGLIYEMLEEMGFNVIKPLPALCGLTSDYRFLKRIEGVRIKCMCSLYTKGSLKPIYQERGEIVFNKNGLSGIPVMNMSRFAINEIRKGNKPRLSLDFFPDMDKKDLKNFMASLLNSSVVQIGDALSALINDKLLKIMFVETRLKFDARSDLYDIKTLSYELGNLASIMKEFEINITGDTGFENAQATQGGVSLKEVNEKTMESYKYPGMYLAGEVLDVDGMCGGYNLQWAWTTGYIAGRS